MVSIARILRVYREAGSLNGLLALWGFVDDTTFLTKAGHVGVVYVPNVDVPEKSVGSAHSPSCMWSGSTLIGEPSARIGFHAWKFVIAARRAR